VWRQLLSVVGRRPARAGHGSSAALPVEHLVMLHLLQLLLLHLMLHLLLLLLLLWGELLLLVELVLLVVNELSSRIN
jgi:hypothetical protein